MMTAERKEPKVMRDIRELYDELDHKTNFTILAAEVFKRSPQSLRVHWFGNFWSIPVDYQKPVRSLLRKVIREQRKNKQ